MSWDEKQWQQMLSNLLMQKREREKKKTHLQVNYVNGFLPAGAESQRPLYCRYENIMCR